MMQLNWGIIGAGSIAKAFAVGAKTSSWAKLYAVASRDKAKADKFAADYGVTKAYGSYNDLLADPQVQAVYVCTPHPMHAQWAIAALEAQLTESREREGRMREALEAFVAAQAMPNYGEYSKIDWKRPHITSHEEWGGGDCEKHGRWYGAGCICCNEDWKKLKNKADREAEYNQNKALRAASELAQAALAAEKEQK